MFTSVCVHSNQHNYSEEMVCQSRFVTVNWCYMCLLDGKLMY